jgi:4-amino-4-deoxy-L-arabinose transferase-like glycosyltransferase
MNTQPSTATIDSPRVGDLSRPRKESWLDPTGRRAGLLLAIVAALFNGIWILLDHSVPSWDQSHYLDVAWQYKQALDINGVHSLLGTIHNLDPSRGPLFPVLLFPLSYIFGSGPRSAMALNFLMAIVLYFSAGEIAAIVFRNWRARLLAIVVVAMTPILVGLYHQVLQDFLMATLATLSILLLMKSELFSRRWVCVALGVTMGLGTLAKVTFPAFVIGPLVIIAAQTLVHLRHSHKAGDSGPTKRVVINLILALAVFAVLAAPWYITNFGPTREYIEWTTEPGLGVGPENPFTAHAVIYFTSTVITGNISWVIGFAGLIAAVLCVPNIRDWIRRRPVDWQRAADLGCLLTLILIPYLSVAFAHNQDVRLMAPGVVGVGILVAGAVAAIRWRGARIVLATVLTLALVYQTANRITDLHPDFLPEKISFGIGADEAWIPLTSEPIGYEVLPRPDYGAPILSYIESLAREPDGSVGAANVCLLESEPIINGNSIKFLADERGDPFTITEVPVVPGPDRQAELAKSLKTCDYALYVKQAPITADTNERLAVVNASVAARFMTPEMLRIFGGPRKRFYVGQESPNDGEPRYLSLGNSGEYVEVLSQ